MRKIVLLTASLLPLAYVPFVMFYFDRVSADIFDVLHVIVVGIYVVGLYLYFRDIRENEAVPSDKKALWSALILFGASFAQIAYFFLYVNRGDLSRAE